MPLIRPFRALRYGSDLATQLPLLVSPATAGEPEDRSQVGDVHEFCVRRLVRGDIGPLARPDEPPFTHAARLLRGWQEDGIVVRDPRPAMYVYGQDDGVSRRLGLVSLVRLGEADSGQVLPHEETRGGSTAQLHAQLDAMDVQVSLTMALVPDSSGRLASFLQQDHGRAELDLIDGAGRRNATWRCEDPAVHLDLLEALRPEVAVIADGHHRWNAALRHREGRGGPSARREHASDYAMVLLVPVSDAGLRCDPTHRVCPSLSPEAAALLPTLLEHFELCDLADDDALDAFLAVRGGVRMALVRPGSRQGLVLRDDLPADILATLPGRLAQVDAAVAEHLLVGPLGGADTGRSGSDFAHNRASGRQVATLALAGEVDLAVVLRPTPPRTVLEVAQEGLLMPPKSSNFMPKPVKGLLMASLATF